MQNIRSEEKWAQAVIQQELRRTVEFNDDNSLPSMYDFRVGPIDSPEMAIECVGAINPKFIETWKLIIAREPRLLPVDGDWYVTLKHDAIIKDLETSLELILKDLEIQGIYRIDDRTNANNPLLSEHIDSLGITSIMCFNWKGAGKVYLTTEGGGSLVDERGRAIPGWIESFLNDPARRDVILKLNKSNAEKREVFVIVGDMASNDLVESYLMGGYMVRVPDQAPELPPPVTGVWIVSSYDSGKGIRWDGTAWTMFTTTVGHK